MSTKAVICNILDLFCNGAFRISPREGSVSATIANQTNKNIGKRQFHVLLALPRKREKQLKMQLFFPIIFSQKIKKVSQRYRGI